MDLSASFGSIRLKNPIIGASSPVTQIPEICEKASRAGASALILKTHFEEAPGYAQLIGRPHYGVSDWTGLHPWHPIPPKKTEVLKKSKKGVMQPSYSVVISPLAIPLGSFWLGDEYIDYYKAVKKRVSEDCLIVPSIYAVTKKGWKDQCQRVRKMKARVVHLNLACPILAEWPGIDLPQELKTLRRGEPPAANTEVCRKITKFCIDHLDIPVVVKFHPFSFANIETALAIQDVGAQGIEFADSNTSPMLIINPKTASPGWHPDFPTLGGSWGTWIIQYICGAIFQMRKAGVKIDITATGGVSGYEDIVRYLMVGASSVGIARTIMVEGWAIVAGWLEELSAWIEVESYKSVEEIKSIVINKVVMDPTKLSLELPQIMGGPQPNKTVTLAKRKCLGCGWCEACCMYCAVEIVNGHPVIEKSKCEVCGMCVSICPSHALTLE